ncbi:MAG: Thioredoxin [Myxococcaceae bacterium]|nr:Thioredoxin [Myxococcaceae bacterium]
MKRVVLSSLALLLACEAPKGASHAALPSRVEAISARRSDDSTADLCDVAPARASAPVFSLPKLEGRTPPAVSGPRWVNLWATWCPPCVEELPRLKQLAEQLGRAGSPVALQLVSVDTTASAVEAFSAQHPEVLGSPRLADPMALEAWLTTLGLDKGATLPVHIFVAADGKVACVRTGSIRDSDLPALKKLLAGS